MTKNAEYEISIYEIIKVLKYKWKIICLAALIGIVICGGYKAVTGSDGTHNVQSYDDYKKDLKLSQFLSETEAERADFLMAEWKNISQDRINNPIYSIDPYNCNYEQVVIRFENENTNNDWAVSNWIHKTDNQGLFGDEGDELSNYKSSLIVIAQKGNSVRTSETAVQIIAVKGFDVKRATDYLIKKFNQFAAEDDIAIVNILRVSAKGYNENVERYQQNSRDRYNSIAYTFTNTKTMSSNITVPTDPSTIKNNASRGIIKYCLLGLVLGIVLAIACIILSVIRKREIVGVRQVENTFDLVLLSDCSTDSGVSLDVLNANLDVMTEEHSTIVLITESFIGNTEELVSGWTKKSDREFMLCTDIFDDPESIEALKSSEGCVIGIKLGKSKLDQIQRIILRANKLNLNVLGCVLL